MWYDYKIQMWILEMDHCRQCCITNVRSSCDITDENDVESNRCSYVIMIKWALCWWVEWRRKWFSFIDGHRIQCFLFFIWNHVKSCEKMFSLLIRECESKSNDGHEEKLSWWVHPLFYHVLSLKKKLEMIISFAFHLSCENSIHDSIHLKQIWYK